MTNIQILTLFNFLLANDSRISLGHSVNPPVTLAEIAMVTVYWLLVIFWLLLVANLIFHLIWKPLYKTIPEPRKIMYGFLSLAIILLLDSLYWALANTSRVNLINKEVSVSLYGGWFITSIKGGFLLAAIIYWVTIIRTYRQIERRFETLFFTRYADQIKDAIGVLDIKGKVLYWNRGAEDLYGQKREYVIGKHIKNFLVPERLHKQIDKTLEEIKETRESKRFTTSRLKFDKSEVTVDIVISPWFHENGNFGGYFGTMREVSDYLPPSVNEIFNEENSSNEKSLEERVSAILVEVFIRENKKNTNRKKVAIKAIIFLLLVACVLMSLTLFFDKTQNYYFVIASIVSIVGEIIPLKYLLKNRVNDFKEIAFKEIIEREPESHYQIQIISKLIDDFGQNLITTIPDTNTIMSLINDKLSLPEKNDKRN